MQPLVNYFKRFCSTSQPEQKCSDQTPEAPTASLNFADIYEKNGFLGSESRSGEGSSLHQTEVIRIKIPELLHELGISTMLDVPCGDWHWMRHVDLSGITYIGGDVVQAIADDNHSRFANEHVSFRRLNIIEDDLPKADLILCRDCLVHLSHADGTAALQRFKHSGATWLLTTTFTERSSNSDLFAGGVIWRPLNLEIAPYNLGKAQLYINEDCTEEGRQFTDKCLALWRLNAN